MPFHSVDHGKSDAPLFVSFYTPDKLYTKRARKLSKNLRGFGLDFHISKRDSNGSWVKNAAMKPLFIQEMLHSFERPVFWLDADCLLLRTPDDMTKKDFDIAVTIRDGWNIASGHLIFANNSVTRDLVNSWVTYSRLYPEIWDQVTLGYALWDLNLAGKKVRIRNIPEVEMVKRDGIRGALWYRVQNFFLTEKVTYYHYQASRFRNKAYQGDFGLQFGSHNLPIWWRECFAAGTWHPLSFYERQSLGLVGRDKKLL
jgi:hypothetical protein